MENTSCSFCKKEILDGETFYVCHKPTSPIKNHLCDPESCVPIETLLKKHECIFNDYNGLCQNDDADNYGDYCPGNCTFYESK